MKAIKIYSIVATLVIVGLSVWVYSTKKELKVATKDGFIKVNSLQFPGKKKMQTHELLNGIHFSDSTLAF